MPNSEKGSILGWVTFIVSLLIQSIAATWIIASMNAGIKVLTKNVEDITTSVTALTTETQQNSTDIKLIQQQLQQKR